MGKEILCGWCKEFIKEWYATEGEVMDDKCPMSGTCDQESLLYWKKEIEGVSEGH